MNGRRLLYAPNVYQGGGRYLLLPLLQALKNSPDVIFVLDARMILPEDCRLLGDVYRIKPTILSRLWCELRLPFLVTSNMLLLCMGNLPPLFVRHGFQQVFVQNRYLVDDLSLAVFPLSVRIRLTVERWWLRFRFRRIDRFIVQTPTMQRLMKKSFGVDAEALPFVSIEAGKELSCNKDGKRYDYLYVASGEPHKNHKTLVKAWINLAEHGSFPSLCLTLDTKQFSSLCTWISTVIQKHSLNILLIGECSHDKIMHVYSQSSAMIYPSLFESFGLPLIEAVVAKLPVLASNESYVHDVIIPSAVFDATSSNAIADAVRSFDSKSASLSIDLSTANEFLAQVFSKVDKR